MWLRKNYLILEFTEFNLQRFNPDTSSPAIAVDDPSLSIDAFDKHEDLTRQALYRIKDITNSLRGSTEYSTLRSKLALEDQDISSLKVIRILKSTNLNYDVYLNFQIGDSIYWGVIKDILFNPELKSEVFKDYSIIQTKEWVIKIKGLIIKIVKNWIKPQFGYFKLESEVVICYSNKTGKLLKLPKGSVIEVLKSYDDKIVFEFEKDQYTLTGDNFIYFNYWFKPISESENIN